MNFKLYLIVFAAFAILLAGCVQTTPTTKPTATPAGGAVAAAKKSLDCRTLSGISKDKCYYLIAFSSKNELSCDKIDSKLLKAQCKGKVLQAKSKKTVDCKSLTGLARDKCYSLLAQKTKNLALVEKITNPAVKADATAKVSVAKKPKKVLTCADLTGLARDKCYALLAKKTKDPLKAQEILAKIQDQKVRDATASSLVAPKAKKQVVNCDARTTLQAKNVCYYFLALETKDPQVCNRITGNDAFKNTCLRRLGVLVQDVSVCRSITEAARRDSCIAGIALKTSQRNLCDGIENLGRKTGCQAAIDKNANACESLGTPATKNECYYAVALATKNPALCQKILPADAKSRTACEKKVKAGAPAPA